MVEEAEARAEAVEGARVEAAAAVMVEEAEARAEAVEGARVETSTGPLKAPAKRPPTRVAWTCCCARRCTRRRSS
jgi:hypothetical protein